jgi:hypothetical protein
VQGSGSLPTLVLGWALAATGTAASNGDLGNAKKTAVRWYLDRMNGQYTDQYHLIWGGQSGNFSVDDFQMCVMPVAGVIFDVWYLAHHGGSRADGIKINHVDPNVTVTPSGSNTPIQGLAFDVSATRHGKVVDKPVAERIVLTKDTSGGDDGKHWKVVVNDVNNPCDQVDATTPTS